MSERLRVYKYVSFQLHLLSLASLCVHKNINKIHANKLSNRNMERSCILEVLEVNISLSCHLHNSSGDVFEAQRTPPRGIVPRSCSTLVLKNGYNEPY